ncbi:MAG: hypothetical protein QW291_05190 [Thermofilaceae archaeon]
MARFAGINLKSGWGLSSEIEVISPRLCETAIKNGASIIFTPTITAKDPLDHPEYYYPRFNLLSDGPQGPIIITRPLSSHESEIDSILVQKNDAVKVASIAAGDFKTLLELLDKYERKAHIIEFDLMASCLLAKRNYIYIAELAGELKHVTKLPLSVKIPLTIAQLIDITLFVEENNIDALVVSPNLVYAIGDHYFRIHSPFFSTAALVSVAEVLHEINVNVAFVTRTDVKDLESLIPIRLYDVTYAYENIGVKGIGWRNIPLSWKPISRKLKIFAREAVDVCPYGLIISQGFVEGCNYCGVCIDLSAPGLVKLASYITPQ